MGRGNGIALGRFHLWQSNWLYARWLPPSWGCAPSHLPPVGRYKRSPLQGNDTGHWRGSNDLQKTSVRIATGGTPAGAGGAVTIRRRLSCALSAATRRGSLRLGAAPQATADCQSSATLFFRKLQKAFSSRDISSDGDSEAPQQRQCRLP